MGILLRRSKLGVLSPSLNTYTIGDKRIDFTRYEFAGLDDVLHALTRKETLLLKLLIERKGEVVSREMILDRVWNYDVYPSTRTIDNFILSFRKYFEEDPKNPKYFHSIRGTGYKFTDLIKIDAN